MKFNINLNTLPKLNSSPLKNDGWKTILSYWVPVTFGVVKFREGINWTSWWFQPIWKILVKRVHLPQIGMKITKSNIWNHQPVSCAWKFESHISQPSILEYHHIRKSLYLSNHIFYFPLPRLEANPIRHQKWGHRVQKSWFSAKTGGGAVWGFTVVPIFYREKRYLKHRFNQFSQYP